MRILAAHPGPQFSVHDVYIGWVEALQNAGNQVAGFNLSERLTFYESAMVEVQDKKLRKALTTDQAYELATNGLYAALYKLRPDVLFVVSAFFYPLEMFDVARSYGTKVVVLHTESPYEDDRQFKVAAHADLNLINDPTNIDKFREYAPTEYAPHSYRPSLHTPGPASPDLQADLAFVGTGYRSRIEFLEAMNIGQLDVLLAGNWQQLAEDSPLRFFVAHDPQDCLDNRQTVDVYRSAKVGINIYRREAENAHLAEGWACGPREIEMAACGLFFLRENRPESDLLFPMLPSFSTPDEASDELHWWLDHPDMRRERARQARESIKDRTFTRQAVELMRLLEEGK